METRGAYQPDTDSQWRSYDIREGGQIVAAAASRPGEYVYAQCGPDDGLQAAADAGLARHEVPSDPRAWNEIDTFRALLFGVVRGRPVTAVGSAEWASSAQALDELTRILASDLDRDTEVTTFAFPSREVASRMVRPDPAAREARLRDEEDSRHRELAANREYEEARRVAAVGAAEREAAEAAAREATEKAAIESEQAARLADSDHFGMEDLLDALKALNRGPYYLKDWGKTIVAAVEQLEDARGKRRVDFALFDTLKTAAEKRYQSISPFDGMLEAPKEVADIYQRHREALQRLVATRDDVLDGVLRDLTSG